MNDVSENTKRDLELVMPSEAEDEFIESAVEADPDADLLSREEVLRMRPAEEIIPDFAKALRRGAQKAPKKVKTTIRLDADVIAAFKERGERWQTEVNAALRKVVGL